MAKQKSTALRAWDEELAKQAMSSAKMEENIGGGRFFGTKGGILTYDGNTIPKNRMAVVVLASVIENAYYAGKYDPSNPQSPTCFAFGTSEADMAPHSVCVEAGTAVTPQEKGGCGSCPLNEYGSADTGKGKACKNQRRLAVIPAGEITGDGKMVFEKDEQVLKDAEIGYLRVPPTSLKAYAGYVKQTATLKKRPLHGVATLVLLEPGTPFKMSFQFLGNIPDDIMAVVMERREEALSAIEFPYPAVDGSKTKFGPKKGAAKSAAAPAAKGGFGGKKPTRKF